MKKSTKAILTSMLALMAFAYCTPKAATSSDDAVANNNYTEAQLEEGHMLWQNNCGKCHKLYPPENYDWERWKKILDNMIPKAKLTKDQGELVSAYIYNNLNAE